MDVAVRSRPKDARARRSRESLREALIALLGTKPYAEVSVRDVAAAAGVSYPTFFRNYASKGDLLGDIGTRETRQLLKSMLDVVEQRDPAVSARAVCEFVIERKDLWRQLLNSDASVVMRHSFVVEASEFSTGRSRMLPDFPLDLSASFFIGAMFEILNWWLRQEDETPVEEVERYLEKLVLRPTMIR